MRRPEQGMRGLEPGVEASIGDRNWHAVSSQLEVLIDSLSHRTPAELAGALGQLEEMLPDLGAEIGMHKDTLDLAKVGTAKKLAAMIFARFFPELRSIVRRAELREGAEVKLKNLERVRDQLREMRIKLGEKIDEALEMSLRDNDRGAYDECQRIREREALVKSYLQRLKLLDKEEDTNVLRDLEQSPMSGSTEYMRKSSEAPYVLLYEEITGQSIVPSEQQQISDKQIASKLRGLEIQLTEELARLRQKRAAILQPKRLEFSPAQGQRALDE